MAQNDTLSLKAVEIKSTVIEKISGFKKTEIDSATHSLNRAEDLSDILARHTPVFIKSYGQGMLATSSFRGTGASHTQVLWNGMTINSPMLGQVDFSTIPVFFTDRISLYHGGSSLALNSGALGGSINLENVANWKANSGLAISHRQGSFNTQSSFMEIRVKENNILTTTRLLHKSSENDFPFKNNAISREHPPVDHRKNASFDQYGIMQEVYHQTEKSGIFSVKAWWQDHFREIPTPLLVPVFKQHQESKALRSAAQWDLKKNKTEYMARAGYQNERLDYYNGLSGLNNTNWVSSFFGDFKIKQQFEKFRMNAAIRHEHHSVEADNYASDKTRDKTSLVGGARYLSGNRFSAFIQIRQDYADDEFLPIIPSLGFDLLIARDYNLFLKANASRNYHLPSLNDLYWSPNGNPNLEPEEGYSVETGFMIKELKMKKTRFNAEITGFYSHINNWIHWKPDEIYSYWRPSNLRKVRSHGLESSVDIGFYLGNFRLTYKGGYTFTVTENGAAIVDNDASVNKQLIYIPRHMLHSIIRMNYRKWYVSYGTHYTGKRFTTSDNSRYMPSYWIADFSVGWQPQVRGNRFVIQLDVNNLWNNDYQSVAWHPMPGRNIHLKIGLRIDNTE
ncbi:MAG: TonB-dependent receptor [Bacteroidales bacterium]|nr:TonB-dependent receptor [Bacteroidales bacterium]